MCLYVARWAVPRYGIYIDICEVVMTDRLR
jgi:hypothetical protein